MKRSKRSAPIKSDAEHSPAILAPITGPFSVPDEVRKWYAADNSEQCLAKAYAFSHVRAVVTDDEVYDHEEGTEEYQKAAATADAWSALEDELVQNIVAILKEEGIQVPEKGYIYSLIPFMERNGFRFSDGWWIRSDK